MVQSDANLVNMSTTLLYIPILDDATRVGEKLRPMELESQAAALAKLLNNAKTNNVRFFLTMCG